VTDLVRRGTGICDNKFVTPRIGQYALCGMAFLLSDYDVQEYFPIVMKILKFGESDRWLKSLGSVAQEREIIAVSMGGLR
jgi:hypothetical protein